MLLTRGGGRSREGPRGGEGSVNDGTKVVVLLKGGLLLFQLHGAHASDSLFSLDALLFTSLKDFLVFYTQFAALDVEAIECGDDCICVYGLTEVCESETSELTGLIEMVIEGIRGWDRQRCLWRVRMRRGWNRDGGDVR